MAIYKNANLDISVSAEQNPSYNAKPSVQFSTQDKNTAKYTFTVKQNNKPVDLTGVTASVTLYSEDKSVFQSDATITSATEGKIEYVIPSEAIRHHGKTRGDLRLTYPNGDVLGGLRFSFNIEQALIDRAAGVVGGVYIRDFEQLKAEIEATAESIKDFDVARVDMELREKATKDELRAVASGSPKGAYPTLADLETTYPNGTEGVYVVQEDGKWYYWNTSKWTPGGDYMSNYQGIQVFQSNPTNPFLGQMWLVQAHWEMFYQYTLTGVAKAPIDTSKMTTLHRGQTGQAHTELGTFAKISEDGNSANISYNPSVTGVNRGDTSLFPSVEEFNLNSYKYKIGFDMTLMGPNKTTETLGFALQSDSNDAIIDQLNNLQIRTAYVSATQNYLQLAQVLNGKSTNIQNVTYTRGTGYDGLSRVVIEMESNLIKVYINGEKVIDTSIDLSVYATGYKPSLFTQNRTKITSGVTMDNKVANLTIERYGL